jgi:hypothetical protein
VRARRFLIAPPLLAMALLLACAPAASAADQVASMKTGIMSDGELLRGDQAGALAEMHRLGVQVVRVGVSWHDIASIGCDTVPEAKLREPDGGGCYDWRALDPLVKRARRYHMDLLFSVGQAPSWASGNNRNSWAVGPALPGGVPAPGFERSFHAFVPKYADFVHAIGTRYAKGSKHGRVRYWTIWNEPNSKLFWIPYVKDQAAAQYAELYAAGARALHEADPSAQVAPGPTGPNSTGAKPGRYIPDVLHALERYGDVPLDAWAHNPYPIGTASPRDAVFRMPVIGIGNVDALYALLDAHPLTRGKPVWFAEFSYQTDPPDPDVGISWQDQSDWIGDYFDIAASSRRVAIALWYVLRDPVNVTDWQSGLDDATGHHKPAWHAFQRPVGLDITSPRSGAPVRIWGTSTLDPHARLVVAVGGGPWRRIVGTQRIPGLGMRATLQPTQTVYVAVQDRHGVGPARFIDVPSRKDSLLDGAIRLARPQTWQQFSAVAGSVG